MDDFYSRCVSYVVGSALEKRGNGLESGSKLFRSVTFEQARNMVAKVGQQKIKVISSSIDLPVGETFLTEAGNGSDEKVLEL